MRHERLAPSLADLVTAANAVCGFAAIVIVARAGEPGDDLPDAALVAAVTLIVAGAVLDSVDGIVARRFGGSPLGEHLEVMSDVVTFGLAPAVLFAVDAAEYGAPWTGIAAGAAAVYVVAALMRLARYIVLTTTTSDHELTGFPAPAAAMGVVAIVGLHGPPLVAVAGVLAFCGLMVASFAFPVMTGGVGRFMVGWFAFAFVAILALPHWVPAVATLVLFAGILAALSMGRLRASPAAGTTAGGPEAAR